MAEQQIFVVDTPAAQTHSQRRAARREVTNLVAEYYGLLPSVVRDVEIPEEMGMRVARERILANPAEEKERLQAVIDALRQAAAKMTSEQQANE